MLIIVGDENKNLLLLRNFLIAEFKAPFGDHPVPTYLFINGLSCPVFKSRYLNSYSDLYLLMTTLYKNRAVVKEITTALKWLLKMAP